MWLKYALFDKLNPGPEVAVHICIKCIISALKGMLKFFRPVLTNLTESYWGSLGSLHDDSLSRTFQVSHKNRFFDRKFLILGGVRPARPEIE